MNKHISIPELGFQMEFIYVRPGECVLGFDLKNITDFSILTDPILTANQHKQRKVEFSEGFYLAKYPLTWGQLHSIFQFEKNINKAKLLPANNYVLKTVLDRLTYLLKIQIDIPTTDQWEYACRAGTTTNYYFGNTVNKSKFNLTETISEVNAYPPNPWGFYDLIGNGWEICIDSLDTNPSLFGLKGGKLNCSNSIFNQRCVGMSALTSFCFKCFVYIHKLRPCINLIKQKNTSV